MNSHEMIQLYRGRDIMVGLPFWPNRPPLLSNFMKNTWTFLSNFRKNLKKLVEKRDFPLPKTCKFPDPIPPSNFKNWVSKKIEN